jgi:hypothetical protein
MIIKYLMHRTGRGESMKAPEWIEDGGYFYNPVTHEYIGWSPDLNARKYYVPDTVETYTLAELTAYVQGLHADQPMTDEEGNDLTDAQVATRVSDWLDLRGN